MTQIISTFENGTNNPNCTPRPTGFDSISSTWFNSIHFDGSTNVSGYFDTLVDTENKLSITSSASHDGARGLLYTHNSTTESYGKILLGTLGYYYTAICNFWLNISGLHVSAGKSTVISRIISITNQSVEEPAFDIEVDGDYPNQLKFSYYTKTSWIDTPVKTFIGYSPVLGFGYHHIALGFDTSGIYNSLYGTSTIMIDDEVCFRLIDLLNPYAVHSYLTLGCIESDDDSPSGTVKFDTIYVNKDSDSSPMPTILAKEGGNYGAGFYFLNPSNGGDNGILSVAPGISALDFSMDINVDYLYPSTILYDNDINVTTLVFAYNANWDIGFEIDLQYDDDNSCYNIYAGHFYYDGTYLYKWTNSYSLSGWKNIGIQWDNSGAMSILLDGEIKETITFPATSFKIEEIIVGAPQISGESPYGAIYMDNITQAEIPVIPDNIITPTYNIFDQLETPGLILCNPNKAQIYPLGLAYGIKNTLRYNALSELEFDYARVEGSEAIYDAIQGKMVVLVTDIGYYIIETVPETLEGSVPIKHVTCLSLEAEMLSRRLTGFAGTYEFSDLLDTVLNLIPTWTAGTIGTTLLGMYRTFDSNNSTIYNFVSTEMAKAYGCVFTFDSFTKTVSAIANVVPAANTNIYLSLDNLISRIEFKEITEEICTALYCYGGESLDIHPVNPLGTNVMYNFDYFKTTDWMSQGLIDALDAWEIKVALLQPTYADKLTELESFNANMLVLVSDMAELVDEYDSMINIKEVRLQQGLSVTAINAQISAQLVLITSAGIDISTLQQSINFSEITLREIVHSLFFDSQISYGNFETDVENMGATIANLKANWQTIYISTSLSPGFDPALLASETPAITNLMLEAQENNATLLAYLVAGFSTYPASGGELATLDTYIDNEIDTLNSLYTTLQTIIPNTSVTISIDEIKTQLIAYLDIVTYSANMTEAQYLELTAYIYENTYINSNIIITDIMTATERQQQSQQLYDQSLTVLERVAFPRYEFSGDFSNLIALKEFLPFTNELDLGKVITIGKDDNLTIEAVLLEIAITYDDPTNFGLTFSNSLRLDNSKFIYSDLLGAAAQLGSNLGVPTVSPMSSIQIISTALGEGGGGGTGTSHDPVTLFSVEHGLALIGQELDFPLFSTHVGANSDGYNIWIGGGGENSIGVAGETYRGAYNVSVGMEALQSNTTGFHNVAIGTWALGNNTTGVYNYGLGTDALWSNTTGNDNIGIGPQSLNNNTKGGSNIAIGSHALETFDKTTDTATYNIVIGRSAGSSITTGTNNTIIGSNIIGTTGMSNNLILGVGDGTKLFVYDNSANIAIGSGALNHLTSGFSNVAIGVNTLHPTTGGAYNVAVGEWALVENITGSENTAVGARALRNCNSPAAGHNVAIGADTGGGITGGINNTIIGSNVGGLAANLASTVIIADGAGLIRFYSDETYKGRLQTAITSAKTLTLTSANTYNLTIARTGTVAMVEISASEPTGLYVGMIWIDV